MVRPATAGAHRACEACGRSHRHDRRDVMRVHASALVSVHRPLGYRCRSAHCKFVRNPFTLHEARDADSRTERELDERYPEEGANHFRLDPRRGGAGPRCFSGRVRRMARRSVAVATRLNDPQTAKSSACTVAPAVARARHCRRGAGGTSRIAPANWVQRTTRARDRRSATRSLRSYRRAGFREIPRFGEYVDSPLSCAWVSSLTRR